MWWGLASGSGSGSGSGCLIFPNLVFFFGTLCVSILALVLFNRVFRMVGFFPSFMVGSSKINKEYTKALAYEKLFPQLAQLFGFIPLVERKADLLP